MIDNGAEVRTEDLQQTFDHSRQSLENSLLTHKAIHYGNSADRIEGIAAETGDLVRREQLLHVADTLGALRDIRLHGFMGNRTEGDYRRLAQGQLVSVLDARDFVGHGLSEGGMGFALLEPRSPEMFESTEGVKLLTQLYVQQYRYLSEAAKEQGGEPVTSHGHDIRLLAQAVEALSKSEYPDDYERQIGKYKGLLEDRVKYAERQASTSPNTEE